MLNLLHHTQSVLHLSIQMEVCIWNTALGFLCLINANVWAEEQLAKHNVNKRSKKNSYPKLQCLIRNN